VIYIFLPYYEKISKDHEVFNTFSEKHRYFLTPCFWKRFETDSVRKFLSKPGSANVVHPAGA
jgi:hypothetical protein